MAYVQRYYAMEGRFLLLSLASIMIRFLFSKAFLLNLLLAILVVCGFVAGAYFYLASYTIPDKVVEVPDLQEMDIVEAEVFLRQLHLRDSIIDSVYYPKLPGGVIVNQDPLPLSKAKEGRKIYLTISRYTANMVSLPNVIDQTLSVVQAKLISYGYELGELSFEPYVCDCVKAIKHNGKVLETGDKTAEGIKLDIVVGMSKDDAFVDVPELFGLTLEEAEKLLSMSDLNRGAFNISDCETAEDSLAAKVFKIQPDPGSIQLPQGSSVTLFLTSDTTKIPLVNLDSIKALLR